jgi:hypothetical protein
MVVILRTSDLVRFELAKSILQANGIQFITRGEGLQDIIGAGRLGGGNIAAGPAELAVSADDVEQAQELLGELLEQGPGPDA